MNAFLLFWNKHDNKFVCIVVHYFSNLKKVLYVSFEMLMRAES